MIKLRALDDLALRKQWVMWRVVDRDGKPTKVPLQPNGKPASSTDPKTWSSHAVCAAAFGTGRFAGIGYVFAPDDEFTGIDLDHCVTPAEPGSFAAALGGPNVHAGAWAIVQRLNSYTELSPSGTGLHILVRAGVLGRKRTGDTRWGGEFESYDQGRFFTFTGEHLAGTPETIESRQAELDAVRAQLFPSVEDKPRPAFTLSQNGSPVDLDDVALLEKIRSSKQGAKFAELYDRGAPEGKESEADLALCNILAFWIGPNEDRIDSVFRGSALMRDKWDSPRGETTYGGYTIARALEGRTEFYGQKTAPSVPARPADDDVERTPREEISQVFGLISDSILKGWRSSRKATCRVVLTTASGLELDVDNWRAATRTPATLAQEVRLQLGVEVDLKKADVARLDVLIGKFCDLVEADTVEHKARDLGEALLAGAEKWPVQMDDQASRAAAFRKLQETHPSTEAKTKGTSLAAACIVLEDTVSGKRYVRVQWFIDYVKANAVSSTVPAILEQIEVPGWWSRPNASGKFKATDPGSGKPIYQRLFEVPADWEAR